MMASIAGDEITERISQHYLVDFATYERIKLALSSEGNDTVCRYTEEKHEVRFLTFRAISGNDTVACLNDIR